VAFFVQGSLPFVGDDGQLYLASADSIAQGPDGNGGALHQFYSSGIWKQWADAGVEYVTFQPIDNALADPYDAELIGYHARKQAEVTLKGTQRASAAEAVGVIAMCDGKIRVVEYTELSEGEQRATRGDGQLKHAIANLSMFCFSMTFIEKLNHLPTHALPLHLAYKPVQVLGQSHPIKAWKCERFIFDVLDAATRISVLVCPREDCFAPLKNQSGPDSLPHVQQALQNYGRRTSRNGNQSEDYYS
jgi:UDP-N-acetylglucosamine/UDP-N-acetylgalactosamine diphosphorylase